jgi:hypothetical protein
MQHAVRHVLALVQKQNDGDAFACIVDLLLVLMG